MSLISITYTDEDVISLADGYDIPEDVALARAEEWAKHIENTAASLISEQLYNVVTTGQP